MEAALAMLGRRAYPAAGVRERLARTFEAEEVERVVARLTELAVLDDRAYAERFARDRFERAGYGRERIRADLLARGIAREHVETALRSVVDDAGERERAVRALGKFRSRARGEAHEARETAFRHLVSRGYPVDLVRDLIDRSL
jgi:regulatory protein